MTPSSEFDRRLKAIRARMDARDLDLLLIYSTPGSLRFGQRGHVMYVSGYEPYFGDTMLLLPRRASPPPLLEIDSASHFSRLSTWVDNVKRAGDHVQTLHTYLGELGLPDTGDLQVEDQFRVTEEGGQRLSPIPLQIFTCGPA